MGLDLTLVPERFGSPPANWFLCYDRLTLLRDYHLYSQIQHIGRGYPAQRLSPRPVPPEWRVQWYRDEGLRDVTEDCYGTPLTWMPAGDFHRVTYAADTCAWNRGVLAFLRALPPETPVLLWWS